MHLSAMNNGKAFFDVYAECVLEGRLIDINTKVVLNLREWLLNQFHLR